MNHETLSWLLEHSPRELIELKREIDKILEAKGIGTKPKEEPEYTIDTPMPFGRYQGVPLGELDPSYIRWFMQDKTRRYPKLQAFLGTLVKTPTH